MKTSLYIRIRNKALGLLVILMPCFFCATALASPFPNKAEYGSCNHTGLAAGSLTISVAPNIENISIPDSSINSFIGSSQYTINNILNRKSKSNFIAVSAMAAPPTIICPGNITKNTDPNVCKALVSGLAAVINDPDLDITTLTWTMSSPTLGASPINGINNLSSYTFNKGVTTVTYRVTDALGASASCSFTVTVTDIEKPNIVCPNNITLLIPSCATKTNPISFDVLSVSDNCGISLSNVTNNAPAQFNLGTTTVTWNAIDNSGNSSQCVQIVTVTNETPMNLTMSSTPVSCFGGSNGSASVTVSEGTPAYTYSWNTVPVQNTSTATNLLPGTYAVTVTDLSGCSATASVTVGQPDALTLSLVAQSNAKCLSEPSGSATVAGIGGTPGYQYSIDGIIFQVSGIFANLAAGTYTISVKDSRNCTNTTSVTILQPATTVSGTATKTDVTCLGTATGSITVSGNGGTPPYQYNLNGGTFQASGIFNNLIAGTYSMIVRDANNCTFGTSVTITQSATSLKASVTSPANVLCTGDANGSATVTASGGTSPYTYSWNTVPAQTTATATGLKAGNYIVTVKDAAGCVETANVTITQPAPLSVSTSKTDVLCFGESTGTATAAASGGTPPYSYTWLTGTPQTTATVSNLPAGTYTVAVFDASGCFKPAFVTINQPATKFTASFTQINVTCAGSNTGSIIVTGSGGIPPYQYNLNGGSFQASGIFNNLAAGTYTILAQDANNCTANVAATITEPATALVASITSPTNVLCTGDANGSATVTASGGTSPYTYSWNTVPVQNTAAATGLKAGNYIVTVKDAAGCVKTANVTITQPTPLSVSTSKTDVLCFGESTGTATAVASGGTSPYSYTWLTGTPQTTATVSNLPAGTYTVAVFDASGCFKPAFVTINQPATKLTASATQVNVACAGNTGLITVTGNGGIPPYQYNINGGTFQASGIFNSLPAGVYNIITKDANNCTFNVSVTITEPANALKASISQINVLCSGQADGSATVSATNGTAPYTYSWNTIPVQTTATISNLTAGTYIVTTTDKTGCVVTNTSVITEPLLIKVSITSQVNYDCASATNGSVTVAGAGGTPNYQYSLNGGPYNVSGAFTNLPVGNYNVTVRDANNCVASIPVNILPLSISADAGISQMLCNSDFATLVGNSPGTGTGSWTLISGPNVPTISPSTGNISFASGLIASVTPYIFGYSINIGSCSTTDTMRVINYAPTTPSFAGNDQNFCNGTGNLTATLAGSTPVNGKGFWTQLAGPTLATIQDATNPFTDVSGLIAGIYTFEWLITNGVCQPNADAVNITVSKPIVVDAGISLSTCESAPVKISGSSVQNYASLLWTSSGDGTFNNPTLIEPVYTPGLTDITTGTAKLILNAAGYTPCADGSDFALLTINKKPLVSAGPDEVTCVGKSKTISLATASDYSNLQWSITPVSAGTLLSSETINPTFTPVAGFSGTATLTLSAQGFGSCMTSETSDAMIIEVNATLAANAGADQTIPPGTATTLTGTVSGGSGFYAWSWQPSNLLVNSSVENPVTVALNAATTFTLTVLDITTGCTDDATVKILMDNSGNIVAVADYDTTLVNTSVTIDVIANDINPKANPLNISICEYPLYGLVVLNSDKTITYTPYSDYEGDDSFCYKICDITKPFLCSDTMVYIRVKRPSLDDLFAYNGISPNSDGNNDVWKIKGIEKYPDNTVLIFNRWGDKLREFANYNNTTRSWDGKNENGDPLPDGTYFYILDVKDVGVLKGWIYLRGK